MSRQQVSTEAALLTFDFADDPRPCRADHPDRSPEPLVRVGTDPDRRRHEHGDAAPAVRERRGRSQGHVPAIGIGRQDADGRARVRWRRERDEAFGTDVLQERRGGRFEALSRRERRLDLEVRPPSQVGVKESASIAGFGLVVVVGRTYLGDGQSLSPLLFLDDRDRTPGRSQDLLASFAATLTAAVAAAVRRIQGDPLDPVRHVLPPSLVPLILALRAAEALLDISGMHVGRSHRGNLGAAVIPQGLDFLLLVVKLLRRQDGLAG